MKSIYAIFIQLLKWGFLVGSLFNRKIAQGNKGRSEAFERLRKSIGKNDKVIWMHAASLGEYEQGLPVLELLKENYPNDKILITFFSPSGFENVLKKNRIADVICYLPFDSKKDLAPFLDSMKIRLFYSVKYEYWYVLFEMLHKREVPVFIVSSLFYSEQIFFKNIGKWFAKRLAITVNWFFHQTSESFELAKSIGLSNGSVSGDTRVDRVRLLSQTPVDIPIVAEFKSDSPLLVIGSSWAAEEEIAENLIKNDLDLKIVIAPHDLGRVAQLKTRLQNAVLYSEIENQNEVPRQGRVLIIDSIGLLAHAYRYADLAVVGGGFHSKGLHNVLEAATYGVGVVIGNHFKKNPEAVNLIALKAIRDFSTPSEAAEFIANAFKDKSILEGMSKASASYFSSTQGAGKTVAEKIIQMVDSL